MGPAVDTVHRGTQWAVAPESASKQAGAYLRMTGGGCSNLPFRPVLLYWFARKPPVQPSIAQIPKGSRNYFSPDTLGDTLNDSFHRAWTATTEPLWLHKPWPCHQNDLHKQLKVADSSFMVYEKCLVWRMHAYLGWGGPKHGAFLVPLYSCSILLG